MFHTDLLSVRTRRAVLAAMLTVAMLLGPLAALTAAQDDEPLQVVASFSALADIVRQVGGDHIEVTSLVPAGGDVHTFDASPDDIRTLEDADLVVQVGDDYEPWLDDLLETAGDDVPRYEAFAAIDHNLSEHGDEHEGDDHAGDSHDRGDEVHRWLDVQAVIHTVTHLGETLAEIDPDNADAYTANAETYIAELEELDAWIVEQTATIPEDQRELITVHHSMGAFADAYGYEIVGVLLESHSTEGADASAGHVAELVEIVEEREIPVLFVDTPGGEDLLQPVASEADVEIAPPLYVETLSADGEGPQSYIEMMRYNVETIVNALSRS
ncbi:MAG TPA: metal ABC transporter substrate-binding protein [Thermomicrobiales bacterium]|nr:metal ABC transporter substrate-binding protein [Thermomicrobiales bacterium]